MRSMLMALVVCAASFLTLSACENTGSGDNPQQEQVNEGAIVTQSVTDLPGCDSAAEGLLFYVLDEEQFYYCDGSEYVVIDLTGSDGQDGAEVTSLNTSASVLSGDYISLTHNLNRDDLTFSEMFEKDGVLESAGNYSAADNELYSMFSPNVVIEYNATLLELGELSNGNLIVAYEDDTNSYAGTFKVFDAKGNLLNGPIVFEAGQVTYASITVLNDDSFVIAYRDDLDSAQGKFVIYDSNANLLAGPTTFHSAAINQMEAVTLSNGSFSISFAEISSNGIWRAIYGMDSSTISAATSLLTGTNTSYLSAVALQNEFFIVAYRESSAGEIRFHYCRNDGTSDSSALPVAATNAMELSTVTMANGDFRFVYASDETSGFAGFNTFEPIGFTVTDLVTMIGSSAVNSFITATSLNNGDFAIGSDSIFDFNTGFSILNAQGVPKARQRIKTDRMDLISSGKDGVAVFYWDSNNSDYATLEVFRPAQLELKIVDSNEARLYNYTNETLDLFLSVNQ